jgi:hypothetical protein
VCSAILQFTALVCIAVALQAIKFCRLRVLAINVASSLLLPNEAYLFAAKIKQFPDLPALSLVIVSSFSKRVLPGV